MAGVYWGRGFVHVGWWGAGSGYGGLDVWMFKRLDVWTCWGVVNVARKIRGQGFTRIGWAGAETV